MAVSNPKVSQSIPARILKHPENVAVNPALLNTHLRVLGDGQLDLNTAFAALMAKITTGSQATGSIAASGTKTITVNLSQAMPNATYIVNATVEGTSLQVTNVLRSKTTVQVTVVNTDAVNPHSGTVMVWVYNQQT